ncbi:MAG: aKG-HExxH-type peptide beta-hydroxylase [Hyphomicrobiales bacterium]
MISPCFYPSSEHGERLAARMHAKLAESLEHIAERVSQAAQTPDLSQGIRDRLGTGEKALRPALYLLYQDLVQAAVNSDVEGANSLLNDVISSQWAASGIQCRVLSADEMGSGEHARYRKYLGEDPTTPLSLSAPLEEIARANEENIKKALALLEQSAPDHAGEVRAIVSEIVFAKNVDPESDEFGGASSFSAWGTIFLSADEVREPFELLCSLVHETAHLALFAEAVHEPLVHNAPEETYESPLREDPRPMDGIFHATFVSARMHHAIWCMQKNPALDSDVMVDALPEVSQTLGKCFYDGLRVIERKGKLSATGQALLGQAADYMNEHSSH